MNLSSHKKELSRSHTNKTKDKDKEYLCTQDPEIDDLSPLQLSDTNERIN